MKLQVVVNTMAYIKQAQVTSLVLLYLNGPMQLFVLLYRLLLKTSKRINVQINTFAQISWLMVRLFSLQLILYFWNALDAIYCLSNMLELCNEKDFYTVTNFKTI